jgi:hypothetical protein
MRALGIDDRVLMIFFPCTMSSLARTFHSTGAVE